MNKKKILLSLFGIVPLFFVSIIATSCNGIDSSNAYILGTNKINNLDTNITKNHTSGLKTLIYGKNDSNHNNGNYCLLLSSLGKTDAPSGNKNETNPNVYFPTIETNGFIKFLNPDATDPINGYTNNKEVNVVSSLNHNIGLVNIIDNETKTLKDNGNDMSIKYYYYNFGYSEYKYGYHTTWGSDNIQISPKTVYLNPFYKWTDADQNNTLFNPTSSAPKKNGNKYQKWAYHHKSGTYASNSSYAKKIRSLFSRLNQLLPSIKFDADNLSTSGTSLCFYHGIIRKNVSSIDNNTTDIGLSYYDTLKPKN